jgi:aminopeptidase N
MKDLDQQSKTIYLSEYEQPDFLIEKVDLTFELGEDKTRVTSVLQVVKNTTDIVSSLVLMGEGLELGDIKIDGILLDSDAYEVTDTTLMIAGVADHFLLQIETFTKPQENFSLEGLYKSSGNYCTQCEAEGFRKITYYLDRPDVLALFSTTIVADKEKYPVLLSNGNPVESGDYDDGRHWAKWEDPYKKPCYLFALVAGDLSFVEDHFTTMNGRDVLCRIYVQHHNIDKCEHAMQSLKKSMLWDEETFGREYDLDVYNIVAVDDFNMGAMENKGLNVFNSKYVLAKQETATDTDFMGIEGVIGHEYFHNWSGNRVTCRDWFQLTLKEGLTVFRDQQFTADMNSVAPKRIDDVNILRTAQFAEDAGPMAHPIQPDSYQEINNFYTVTVYNKGAEIIRMLYTLLGRETFRQGMDLYFSRHDAQAVTTEEFVKAMEDASQVDLKRFRRWYKQAGTPEITVSETFDKNKKTYTLTLSQSTPATPGQEEKLPFHIPVKMSLMKNNAELMPLHLSADLSTGMSAEAMPVETMSVEHNPSTQVVLNLTENNQQFVFEQVDDKPILSVLQGYSAPVKLHFDRDDEELAFCMAHEADEFNRWEAWQQLSTRLILALVDSINSRGELALPDYYIAACKKTLTNNTLDKALIARALTLPSLQYVGEMMPVIDVDAIYRAREFIYSHLALNLQQELLDTYKANLHTEYSLSPKSMGERFLRNQALSYLMFTEDQGELLAKQQYDDADNMTDQIAAFRALLHHEKSSADEVTESFYKQWHTDNLVMDKWFTVQATIPHASVMSKVEMLFEHKDFDIKNPNRVRALLGAFCAGNPLYFHEANGFGYNLLSSYIEKIDSMNPQIASRLCVPLTRWKRYSESRQQLMRSELQRLIALPDLSRDVHELVEKSLK